jgi:hypothetical protein
MNDDFEKTYIAADTQPETQEAESLSAPDQLTTEGAMEIARKSHDELEENYDIYGLAAKLYPNDYQATTDLMEMVHNMLLHTGTKDEAEQRQFEHDLARIARRRPGMIQQAYAIFDEIRAREKN